MLSILLQRFTLEGIEKQLKTENEIRRFKM
jgi:hypothetical protein